MTAPLKRKRDKKGRWRWTHGPRTGKYAPPPRINPHDRRYVTRRVVRSDGTTQRQKVRKDRLRDYNTILVPGRRGRPVPAIERKTPEERVAQYVQQATGGPMVEIFLTAKADTGKQERGTSRLTWEFEVEAIVPEGRVDELASTFAAIVEANNPASEENTVIGEVERRSTQERSPRIKRLDVMVRDERHDFVSDEVARPTLESMFSFTAPGDPEGLALLRGAHYDEKTERYRDAKGRFTFNPNLL